MTRIWMDGFEHEQVHNFLTRIGTNAAFGTGRRGYGKAVNVSRSHATISAVGNITLSLPASEQRSEVFVRLAVLYTGGIGDLKFISNLASNNVICTVSIPSAANTNVVVKNYNNTQIGTYFLTTPGTWLLIQAHFIVANNSGGLVDLRINGTQVANYSGQTSPSAALYSTAQLAVNLASYDIRFDDYAVNDTNGSINNSWVADADILGAAVNGQGVHAEWTGSDGNQVNNYALINGVGTTLSDYVESNTVNQRELYTILPDTNVDLAAREIIAVQPLFIARKTNADDPAALRPMYRQDSVDYELESPQNLDLNWQYHRGLIMELAPDQTPWTESKLENLQVGVKKTS